MEPHEEVVAKMFDSTDFFAWPEWMQSLAKNWLVANGVDPGDVPLGFDITVSKRYVSTFRYTLFARGKDGKLALNLELNEVETRRMHRVLQEPLPPILDKLVNKEGPWAQPSASD